MSCRYVQYGICRHIFNHDRTCQSEYAQLPSYAIVGGNPARIIVLEGGVIKLGDTIKILLPSLPHLALKRV
jgi:hypothetical protein